MAEETWTKFETAPAFNIHRNAVTTVDSTGVGGNLLNKNNGINGAGYLEAVANLMVGAGGPNNVTFEVLFWSDAAGKFISADNPLTFTLANDETMAIRFRVDGRRFIVAITANAAGLAATVEVAASGLDERYD